MSRSRCPKPWRAAPAWRQPSRTRACRGSSPIFWPSIVGPRRIRWRRSRVSSRDPAIPVSAGAGKDERGFMPSAKTSCFVDTNLLIYAIDPAEPEKRAQVESLLRRMISNHILVLSPQSLNECYRVITDRRRLMPVEQARRYVTALAPFCTAPSGFEVTRQAWRIKDASRFGWWDCLLLAAASLAGCGIFLSEDMQHQRQIESLKILSPFKLDPAFDFSL
jgi:predicted nucleic acid-binding protein